MNTEVLNKVIVTEVKESQYGKLQAALRYAEDSLVAGDANSELFSASELGKTSYVSVRMDWVEVPAGSTIESVTAQLAKFPKARIQRKLSLKPILNARQEAVIINGLSDEAFEDFKKTHGIVADEWNEECAKALLTTIANAQKVVYGENNTEGKPADELVLYKGQVQYRVTQLNTAGEADIDLRKGQTFNLDMMLADNPANVGQTVAP